MTLRASSLLLVLTITQLAVTSESRGQYVYHYFKDEIAIGIDRTRIATRSQTAPDISTALTQRGVQTSSVKSGPLKDWYMAELPANPRNDNELNQLIHSATQDPALEFVSPVFLDPQGDPLIVTPWVFISFREGVSKDKIEAVISNSHIGEITERNFAQLPGVFRIHAASKNGFEVLDAVNRLAILPEVVFASIDFIYTCHYAMIPNDAGFGFCWGHNNTGQNLGQGAGVVDFDMDSTDAWDITTGSPSVKVLIMDTGAQQDHPDINQIPGMDFTAEAVPGGGPGNACDNHATAVSGCVSAKINNSIGTVGSCPNCTSVSARIGVSSTNPCGTAFSSQPSFVINALAYANTIGARITNSSFSYGSDSALTTAYNNARNNNGIISFAATGNGGTNTISYPASIPSVSAVGATTQFGTRASFSQFGTGIDYSAPGQTIYMTDRTGSNGYDSGDYTFGDGTSFATPYACGVAGMVLSVKPTLTPAQVEYVLNNSCTDMGTAGYDTTYGYGELNTFNAVTLALSLDTDAPTPSPMSFLVNPHPVSSTAIAMQAVTATDSTSAVQYFFDYTSGSGGHDSGYQSSDTFTDVNLIPNAPFNYRVKARDTSSPFNNETAYSAIVGSSTAIETPSSIQFGTITDTSIQVTAILPSGEFINNIGFGSTGFYFEMTPAVGTGANQWIGTTSTTITGLSPCTAYTLRVKARNFQSIETPYTTAVLQGTTGTCTCSLLGDMNSDTTVNGIDIPGYLRVKLGVPLPGDNSACADFGNNDLDLDTADFVSVLLNP